MKKFLLKTLAGVLLLAAVILGLLAILSRPVSPHPFFSSDDLRVMAHRGGRQLWPENTLTAFNGAAALGVDVLEMDVHSTKDGVLVVLHDDTVDRTTDGAGTVQDFTLEELQSLDASYQWTPDEGANYPFRGQGVVIPTLAEVLEAFPNAYLNVEIKQSEPSIVLQLCELLNKYEAEERVLVASFDPDTIKAFRETCPVVATSAGEDEVKWLFGLSLLGLEGVYSPKAEAVQVPEYFGRIHVVTKRFVNAAHNRGLEVHVWTVNDLNDMQRLLDLGVDGIITDAPDLLLELERAERDS